MEKSFLIDFTKKNKVSYSKIFKQIAKCKKQVTIIDSIYPLKKLNKGSYTIADHINLSGTSLIKGARFIPLNNIYLKSAKNKKQVIVAGLKEGVVPTKKEIKVLLKSGVSGYCYNLVHFAIYAAFKGLKVKAVGIVIN